MLHVKNRGVVRRLSWKTLRAAKLRNAVAVLAIALTTVLFTSLFTIALSLSDGIQQSSFRQIGTYAHGEFKNLTEAQVEELKDNPRIKSYGLRLVAGMPQDAPFNKSHVEVSYCDENEAHWMFCDPIEGRLPQEGTNEAATDTRVLELLGIEPKIGATFTLTFSVDGVPTTQTFTLCGWWTYDEATVASHVLIPQSRVEAIFDAIGAEGYDGMTTYWCMGVMLDSTLHIERDLNAILADHGYQCTQADEDNYIGIGVSWGYTSSSIAKNMDAGTLAMIAVMVLLILFTGYLIIYNVFQISVAGDIRFYGLLKTIGTTPRQLRRIIRQQALFLSAVGIPIGLLVGWLIGGRLTPVIAARMSGVANTVSFSPWLFVCSALFSLLTVALSCARPGRIAARVSPIEAVRYVEGGTSRRTQTRSKKGVSIFSMARANLGRSRGKTVVTVVSLSLAVVLLTVTVMFVHGFDLDKYLNHFVATDFVLARDSQFQSTGALKNFSADAAVPEEVIAAATAQGGVAGGGRTYGRTSDVQEFVTEDAFRAAHSYVTDKTQMDNWIDMLEHGVDGKVASDVQMYGMEDFVLDQLTVLEGDISALADPDRHAIAAVCQSDDYGNYDPAESGVKIGDTVTLRHVDQFTFFNPQTGDVYEGEIPDDMPCAQRAAEYRDITYTVAAIVGVPTPLSYRYYGMTEYALGAQTFIEDTRTENVMYYAFDMKDAQANAQMETFLADYTGRVAPTFNYESKQTYHAEFDQFRSMFLLLGGVLSLIVGLVGVLNFINAILTGILSRRRELAVLQSIGMSGRQLKRMLICEGLLYALAAIVLALLLTVTLAPLVGGGIEQMFWFFTYRFTILPILIVLPVFVLLGVVVPWLTYRAVARATIVERLREAEN